MTKTPSVGIGDAAPDFAGVDTAGQAVKLSDYWSGRPIIAVFLRHLGCTFCREHVVQLVRSYGRLQSAGVEVVCIAMGSDKVGKGFRLLFDVPFPMLMTADADTAPYRAYGLGRGGPFQLFGPPVFARGMAAVRLLGSKFLGPLTGDGLQMPGTFLIDQHGTIRLAYRNRNAADNPPIQLLLDALAELQQGGVQFEDNHHQQSSAIAG